MLPKTRTDWWLNKINGNITIDAKAAKALNKAGWKIIHLWECDLKPEKVENSLTSLLKKIFQPLLPNWEHFLYI